MTVSWNTILSPDDGNSRQSCSYYWQLRPGSNRPTASNSASSSAELNKDAIGVRRLRRRRRSISAVHLDTAAILRLSCTTCYSWCCWAAGTGGMLALVGHVTAGCHSDTPSARVVVTSLLASVSVSIAGRTGLADRGDRLGIRYPWTMIHTHPPSADSLPTAKFVTRSCSDFRVF